MAVSKKIIFITGGLCALQAIRAGLRILVFAFLARDLLSDVIFNLAFMSIAGIGVIAVSGKRGFKSAVWPAIFSWPYIITTIIAAAICISAPFFMRGPGLYDILFLIYASVVTPFYEEILFRGFIWEALCRESEKTAYITSTLLFAVWHLGYIDTVLWRTSLFFPDVDIPYIMLMKAVTGLLFGLVIGTLRYKTKNVYSAVLLHSVMNTLGG